MAAARKFLPGELTQVLMERCPCGHDKNHARVRGECQYDAWGIFGLVFGSWGTPTIVEYVCRDCRKVLERTRDKAVRQKFT
ncbi:MAG: hypothetical protein JST54_10415 [Deltaproteobacteria bacterium]|nr:hypothetical protein [Deltaproteobacteria bacterium]